MSWNGPTRFFSNGNILKENDLVHNDRDIKFRFGSNNCFIMEVNLKENQVLIFAPEAKESKELKIGYYINQNMLTNKPFRIAISLSSISFIVSFNDLPYCCGLGIIPFEKYLNDKTLQIDPSHIVSFQPVYVEDSDSLSIFDSDSNSNENVTNNNFEVTTNINSNELDNDSD